MADLTLDEVPRALVELRDQYIRHLPSWAHDPEEVVDALVQGWAAILLVTELTVIALWEDTYIDTANPSGVKTLFPALDEHGLERGVIRLPSEGAGGSFFSHSQENAYRARIKAIGDMVTRPAILAAVQAILDDEGVGTASMVEHHEGPDPAGTTLFSLGFVVPGNDSVFHPALDYFHVVIPDQAPEPRETGFMAPTGTFDDSRSFMWAQPESGPYPQSGQYLEPAGLHPDEIYQSILDEVERLRAAAVSFRVVIQ